MKKMKNLQTNDYRYMTFLPKNKYVDEALNDKLNIKLEHGMIITMHGTTQKEFTHGIEQNMNSIEHRISISFRQMLPIDM